MSNRTFSFEYGGRTIGPVTAREIERLVSDSLLSPQHAVVDSTGRRMTADEVRSLQSENAETPAPPPLPPSRSTDAATWNPLAIAWLGLVFSPIWSAIMAALNARRLGGDLPKGLPILVASGLFLTDVGIGLLVFESNVLSLLLFVVAAWLVWRLGLRPQLVPYNANAAFTRQSAGWLVPALAGAPAAVIVFCVFIVSPLIPPEPEWITANQEGLLHYDNGECEAAIAKFSEAISLNPSFTEAYINRGLARLAREETSQAVRDFDTAIQLNPELSTAFHNRGIARHRRGEADAAIADLSEAIRIDPNDALSYNVRGVVYCDNGKYDKAVKDFDEALRLDPDVAEARENKRAAQEQKANPVAPPKHPALYANKSPEPQSKSRQYRSVAARLAPIWVNAGPIIQGIRRVIGRLGKWLLAVLIAIWAATVAFRRWVIRGRSPI